MKTIALVGAPGVGKSRLAQAIADELVRADGSCDDCNTPIGIVDDYPLVVRDQGEYEIGLNGGYMATVSIAVQRYNMERKFGYDGTTKTMIVCGTIIESATYLAQHFERTLAVKNSEEEKFEEIKRFEACIGMTALLYMDTFKYDKAFYIPPVEAPEDELWMTFERNLQAAFQAYNAPVAPLIIEEFKDADDLVAQRVAKVLA